MHTTIAFSESLDEAGVFANIAAVPDQHIRTQGDFIYVGNQNKIIGAFAAVGALGDLVRLVSPSIRRINPFYIECVELAIDPADDVFNVFHPEAQIPLDPNEGLECESNANPAAAEQHTVVVFTTDGNVTPVTGPITSVRFTINVALTAGTWAMSEIVLQDDIPVGNYQVVGASMVIDGCNAFRFIPIGGSHRPGGIPVPTAEGAIPYYQRYGRLGVWFTFNSVQLPAVEVLGSAAAVAADYEGIMDVIKTG